MVPSPHSVLGLSDLVSPESDFPAQPRLRWMHRDSGSCSAQGARQENPTRHKSGTLDCKQRQSAERCHKQHLTQTTFDATVQIEGSWIQDIKPRDVERDVLYSAINSAILRITKSEDYSMAGQQWNSQPSLIQPNFNATLTVPWWQIQKSFNRNQVSDLSFWFLRSVPDIALCPPPRCLISILDLSATVLHLWNKPAMCLTSVCSGADLCETIARSWGGVRIGRDCEYQDGWQRDAFNLSGFAPWSTNQGKSHGFNGKDIVWGVFWFSDFKRKQFWTLCGHNVCWQL